MCEEHPHWESVSQIDAAGYEYQLRRELAEGHILFGRDYHVIASCAACDDIMLEDISTGQRYVCHLTHGEKQVPPYPWTVEFGKAWGRVEMSDGAFLVDVEATRLHHSNQDGTLFGNCECATCQRLGQHRDELLHPETVQFLNSIGIDPMKPLEAVNMGASDTGGEWVELNYHLRGRIDEGVKADEYGHRYVRTEFGDDSVLISDNTGPDPSQSELRKPWLQAYIWIDTRVINDIGSRSQ